MMSNFSTTTIAAHQAAMNFASLLYMTPLSLAMAMTISVGFEVGAKRYNNAKQYGFIGIGLALAFALLYSILLYFFDDEIASIYTTDIQVHHLAKISYICDFISNLRCNCNSCTRGTTWL